jgi:Domain of unknown function (DUF4384)
MPRYLLCLVLLCASAPAAVPAAAPPGAAAADAAPVNLISIVLEKKSGDSVQTVDPGHVFDTGDTVRFRLRPSVDGYLYVLDLNTSGKYDVLFPRDQTGTNNAIEHGRDYLIPATQGWFQISGPAGHEKLYFVLSPVALTMGQMQNRATNLPPQGTAPSSMRPRCNDGIFKARGECVDSDAGPRTVDPGETLPRDLSVINNGASRDLKFTNTGQGSTVSSSAPLQGPVVYEFLLAHN